MKFFGWKKNASETVNSPEAETASESVTASETVNSLEAETTSESVTASETKTASSPKKHHNGNRMSYGIGTAIIILLAFSCVVGADSFLTENAGTEGENYDMVTPDYYSYSENQAGGAVSGPDETTAAAETTLEESSETTMPETSAETVPDTTTTIPDMTESQDPSAETSDPTGESTVPSEPTEPATPTPTPKPTHMPTPTATPMPTPTPKPQWTEKPYSDTVYATGEVNVRKGPGTEFEITKTLKLGDPIEVVAKTSNEWFKTIKGTYVKCSLCTAYKPVTPTPKPTKAPTPMPKATPTPKPKSSSATPTPKPKATPTPKPSGSGGNKEGMTLIGSDFKITFYGPDWAGSGTDNRQTATRTTCVEGRTVAADWGILPAGTKIYIENDPLGGDGYYVVEDRGSGVNGHHIDIFAENGEHMKSKTGYKVYIVN
ncbi:MAG: 3D domain-containing protein [Saccharofermentanaceae bacterium]|nr:3D domain-containing protein [Saccharofermentanaceae bacterium]